MKYILLTNGWMGYEILSWLMERGNKPQGLVVHPQERQRCRKEICEISELEDDHIIEGPILRTPEGSNWVKERNPDWLVSVLFGYILKPDIISLPSKGAINLHPGFLPYNRGIFPNAWSIVEGTPAGTTLHFIDSGIDTGDIIAQQEVVVKPSDTGESLYARLIETSIALFKETWPSLVKGEVPRRTQPTGGSSHRFADLEPITKIDPNLEMRVQDLINILRARTFPPFQGAYIDYPDRRIYIRLELTEEEK